MAPVGPPHDTKLLGDQSLGLDLSIIDIKKTEVG